MSKRPTHAKDNKYLNWELFTDCIITVLMLVFGSEAVAQRCSNKKLFRKMLHKLRENTCDGAFFSELQVTDSNFTIKCIHHRCFLKTFAKFFGTVILRNTCGKLFENVFLKKLHHKCLKGT